MSIDSEGARPINRQAFTRALNRLEKEADQSGRSLREQLLLSLETYGEKHRAKPDIVAGRWQGLPVEFFGNC